MNPELSPGNPETTGEQINDAVPFSLNDDEKAVITRFLLLVDDNGVKAVLALRVASNYKGSSDIPAEAVAAALEDLDDTCVAPNNEIFPEKIIECAPSMALVCTYLNNNPSGSLVIFPAEFIPSDDLVHKCLNEYFAKLTALAAEMLADRAV